MIVPNDSVPASERVIVGSSLHVEYVFAERGVSARCLGAAFGSIPKKRGGGGSGLSVSALSTISGVRSCRPVGAARRIGVAGVGGAGLSGGTGAEVGGVTVSRKDLCAVGVSVARKLLCSAGVSAKRKLS